MRSCSEVVISAENIKVSFPGRCVLANVSFAIHRGETVGIIGPNGAGKTTLLQAIIGLVPVNSGTMTVLGTKPGTACQRTGYMPQKRSFDQRFPVSVADIIAMGMLGKGIDKRRRASAMMQALESVHMEDERERPFSDLSGGEQQRVLLARALVGKPELLLLDEPDAGLDFPAQRRFMRLLLQLAKSYGMTVVIVSHDLFAVASVADSLMCVNQKIHAHGRSDIVLQSPGLKAAYRCQLDVVAALRGDSHA